MAEAPVLEDATTVGAGGSSGRSTPLSRAQNPATHVMATWIT